MPNADHSEFVREKIRQIEGHRDAEIERARAIADAEIQFWDYGEPTQQRSVRCQEKTKSIVVAFEEAIHMADSIFFRSEGYRAGPCSTDEVLQ